MSQHTSFSKIIQMNETTYVPVEKICQLTFEPCASSKDKQGKPNMKCGKLFYRTSIPVDAIKFDCPSCGAKPTITITSKKVK